MQVRAAMEWVDKYSDFDVWTCLSPVMVKEIKLHLVPLLDSGIKDKDLVIAFDIDVHIPFGRCSCAFGTCDTGKCVD